MYMQHYTFDNPNLPLAVRMPVHLLSTTFLSVITVNILLVILDYFQIGIFWLQQNNDLGIMFLILVLIISFLFFDSLIMPITDTGGCLNMLFASIKDEYDLQVYLKREYTSTVHELDFIKENFAKNFDLETFTDFTNDYNPLEGISFDKVVDVDPLQVGKIGDFLENVTSKEMDKTEAVVAESCEIECVQNDTEEVAVDMVKSATNTPMNWMDEAIKEVPEVPESPDQPDHIEELPDKSEVLNSVEETDGMVELVRNAPVNMVEEVPDGVTEDLDGLFNDMLGEVMKTDGTDIDIEAFSKCDASSEEVKAPEEIDVQARLKAMFPN